MAKKTLVPIINPNGEILGYEVHGEIEVCGGGCGKDEYNCELYMVVDDLWTKHGNGAGQICLSCFEKRLGRPFQRQDFKNVPANNTIFFFFDKFEILTK